MTPFNPNFESALRQFGLESFRPGQREVIESIIAGDDCMCVMPTGGGKSLCYQLPSVIRPGLTIVVSPLIALMKDQVDSLCQRGISAALINSTLSATEQQERLQAVASGKFQLVYVAPERLRNHRFLEAIRATPIQLLAIDEAHCISQWGHDFRPDYARIGRFREWLGGVQTVALTATATPRVRADIVQVLGLKRPRQFMSGFARPNLRMGVVTCSNDREKDDELERFLRSTQGSGIIYAATRKRCEALVEWIAQKLKIPVGAYHAGLLLEQRKAIQERFMSDKLRVIVATNAFGMGIDKPDLRYVIHYNMPGSLEAYYQEAGRAGRDGQSSVCVMLYSYQDRYIQEFFIENNYPPRSLIADVYAFMAAREEDPIELTLEEIRDAMGANVSPEAISSSLQVIARTGVLERLEMGGGLAIVRIDSDLPTLVELLAREAHVQRQVMRTLEKAVGERRGEQIYVHPRWLLQQAGMEREPFNRAIREISQRLQQVDYVPPFRGRAVHFVRRDVPFDQLEIDFEALDKRKQAEYDRLNQVVNYAQSPLCRQATILHYFGDTSAKHCGGCDRCGRSPGWPPLPPTAAPPRPSAEAKLVVPPEKSQPSMADSRLGPAPAAPLQTKPLLHEVVRAIERIHGRIGKILLAQYLCGSQNSKLQKLNLHRLSGFGLLSGLRQSDAIELIDVLLAAGLLRQQEVNKNRPTVSVSPQLSDAALREELLAHTLVPAKLAAKLAMVYQRASSPALAVAPQQPAPASIAPAAPASIAPAVKSPVPPTADSTTPAPALPTPYGLDFQSAEPSDASQPPVADQPDWGWTIMLFQAGHPWQAVAAIRRLADQELAASLCAALRAGASVEKGWLSSQSQLPRTAGQQLVVQALRRQSAAWSG